MDKAIFTPKVPGALLSRYNNASATRSRLSPPKNNVTSAFGNVSQSYARASSLESTRKSRGIDAILTFEIFLSWNICPSLGQLSIAIFSFIFISWKRVDLTKFQKLNDKLSSIDY